MGAPDADGRRGTQLWRGSAPNPAPVASADKPAGMRWMPTTGELPAFPGVETAPPPAAAAAPVAVASDASLVTLADDGHRVGELIGAYRLTQRLGGGDLTSTWEGEHVELGRLVAVKFLRQQAAGVSDTVLAQVRAIAGVQHPHLAVFTDFGQLPSGDPFFVMERLDGEAVSSVLARRGCIPWARAVNVAQQVCLGVAAGHQHGVVHRDVRPGNVFLVDSGSAADFARVVDFAIAQGTRLGGVPAYMSPEQCRHEPLDPSSDVYAIGCLLFAMVTGEPPFGTAGDNLHWRQLNEAPKALRERAPRQFIPDELEAVVARCLQKRPADRYPSPIALNEALADLANFAAASSVAAGVIPIDAPSGSAPMGFAGREPPDLERVGNRPAAPPTVPPTGPTAAHAAAPVSGFSAEAVVGIVLASVLIVGVVGVGVWWLVSRLVGGASDVGDQPALTKPAEAPGTTPAPTPAGVDRSHNPTGGSTAEPSLAAVEDPAADPGPTDPARPDPAQPAVDDGPSRTPSIKPPNTGPSNTGPAPVADPAAADEPAATDEPSEPDATPQPDPKPDPKPSTKPQSKANENIGPDDLVDPWD